MNTFNIKNRSKPLTFKFDIIKVVNERLRLQSTQHLLEQKFNLHIPSAAFLKHPPFLEIYKQWTPEKQDDFIKLVGGTVNKKRTKEFIST